MPRPFEQALASALDDVRQKLVEEPWFGKAVTERPAVTEEQAIAIKLGWFGPERSPRELAAERERDQAAEHELGHDR